MSDKGHDLEGSAFADPDGAKVAILITERVDNGAELIVNQIE